MHDMKVGSTTLLCWNSSILKIYFPFNFRKCENKEDDIIDKKEKK